jgi:hypothetical protein
VVAGSALGKKETPHEQTLKDDSFSPLYVCPHGVYSHLNLRVVAGKMNGRASENFKITQTLCGPEIPPCSPRRAELVKNS